MTISDSILADLEEAIKSGSSERRLETLRRVTDLFLLDADRLNEEQVAVFDDVLLHLTRRIETKAVAELSARLAPVDNAPIETIRQLAHHDEIVVAGPVLTQSPRLTTDDLVDIAGSKGQSHLLAISNRRELDAAVTDVLVERGDGEVRRSLAGNSGARFSDTGFASMVSRAEADEPLALKMGQRFDLPAQHLQDLLGKATEAARARLVEAAPPEKQADIQRALARIADEVGREVAKPQDLKRAQRRIAAMVERGELDEKAFDDFVARHEHEDVIVGLAHLASASIELIIALAHSPRDDGLLIACKAAGLKWDTVKAMLAERRGNGAMGDPEFAEARLGYDKLSQASAQRTVRFWQVRVSNGPAASSSRRPG
jgi:hypothetical protein